MIKKFVLNRVVDALSGSYNHLLKATQNPQEEQEKVLSRIIHENEDTQFGRTHNFSRIHSPSDFESFVPITNYDYLHPWIENEMNGLQGQLTQKPPIMFATTSGTTSSSKFIPVTKKYIDAYKKGMTAWVVSAYRAHPEMAGKVLAIASPRIEGHTPSGIPFGAVSGLMQERQHPIARHYYVSTKDIFSENDPQIKKYLLARAALSHRLTHIHTANPLTIINLCKTIESNAQELIADIYDGRLSKEKTSSMKVKPNPKRAKELEELLAQDEFYPKNFWDVALIGCWTGGTQELFLRQFPKYFGDVSVRDLGLLASEGRMSIPLEDGTASGVLDITNNFYEFIPEGEIDSPNPRALQVHQVQKGDNYFIIPTTSSGLYRYNIQDLVSVTGFLNNTPLIAFLNKGKHITSIVGEKLTEHQVVKAYKESRINGMSDEFIVYPRFDGEKVRYTFISPMVPDDGFVMRFDKELCHSNSEYASKRSSGRIGLPEVTILSPQDFEKVSRKLSPTGKEAQYKHVYLRGLDFSSHVPQTKFLLS